MFAELMFTKNKKNKCFVKNLYCNIAIFKYSNIQIFK